MSELSYARWRYLFAELIMLIVLMYSLRWHALTRDSVQEFQMIEPVMRLSLSVFESCAAPPQRK